MLVTARARPTKMSLEVRVPPEAELSPSHSPLIIIALPAMASSSVCHSPTGLGCFSRQRLTMAVSRGVNLRTGGEAGLGLHRWSAEAVDRLTSTHVHACICSCSPEWQEGSGKRAPALGMRPSLT